MSVGMLLGGAVIFTVALLPVIRGYYYFGAGDSLTYLGQGIELLENNMNLSDIIYPGLHSISIVLSIITGMRIEWGFMLTPAVFSIVFIVFSYMVICSIISDSKIVPIGFFTTLLLLPINQVSQAGVFFLPYPSLLALLFTPVIFYILFLYGENNNFKYSLLLIISTVSILMFHPQQAANVLSMLLMISFFQLLASQSGLTKLPVNTSLYSQTIIFGSLFWLWTSTQPAFEKSISGLVISLLFDTGTTGDVGSVGLSLEKIGASLVELFFKLFFVSLVYCILTGSLMMFYAIKFLNSRNKKPFWRENKILLYLTIGFGPVFVLFLSYIAFSTQYFRHLGFIMTIAGILGSVALYDLVNPFYFNKISQFLLTILFIFFLLLSVMTMHMSPFIYQASPHVSEGHVEGFESTFELTESADLLVTVRSSPSRYGDALLGRSYRVNETNSPDHFADQNLTAHYSQDFYVTVTKIDRMRDPILYNGFRFSEEDFNYLDSDPKVDHAYTNGQFDLYAHG
ncbi:hypothetical protein [Halovenus salina]|uniref:Glucosyl transferase GtrII n=1 Tax=Halovenus salina TaxID=1510225 RepID=A0ABD5W0H6_9EURY|nr:hypothetical protein [Halovenus salina]